MKSDIDTLLFILKILYEHDYPELAKRLITRFGDVRGIFLATHEELMSVEGVSPRAASFFNIVSPLRRQAYLRLESEFPITDKHAAEAFAAAYFMTETKPSELAVYLDGDDRVIAVEKLQGKELVRDAVSGVCRSCAKKLLWLSYRPSETVSARNKVAAYKLEAPLGILGVKFVDYMEYPTAVERQAERDL